MGQFFKFLFASCLGTILAGLVLSFVAFSVVGGMVASAEKTAPVSSNSVLEFKFDQAIPERTNNLEMNPFDLDNQYILGLQDYITSIERAKTDDDIKGCLLYTSPSPRDRQKSRMPSSAWKKKLELILILSKNPFLHQLTQNMPH